jgi:transposase
MAGVMIGIDPHKGSHTALVIDGREKQLGQLRVRASSKQAEALLDWAGRWRQRTWAIEGARGLGNLLAQQLIAAGERVLDVPPRACHSRGSVADLVAGVAGGVGVSFGEVADGCW